MSKVLLIGQALPKNFVQKPFHQTRLYHWFESIGINSSEVLEKTIITALIDYFSGRIGNKDRTPKDD